MPTDYLGRELGDGTDSGPQTVAEFAEENPEPSDLSENIQEARAAQRQRREDAAEADARRAEADET